MVDELWSIMGRKYELAAYGSQSTRLELVSHFIEIKSKKDQKWTQI